MPRSRASAATLGGSSDDTEAAFYEALQRGDIELLMSCWAEDDDIICVHPGGPRLLGAGAIRAAFEAMFSHGTVRARPLQVHRVVALTSAVHSVVEQVEVMLPGRPAPGRGAGHQCLSQDPGRLAPGGPPREPRRRARCAGGGRPAARAALSGGALNPSLFRVWRLIGKRK